MEAWDQAEEIASEAMGLEGNRRFQQASPKFAEAARIYREIGEEEEAQFMDEMKARCDTQIGTYADKDHKDSL